MTRNLTLVVLTTATMAVLAGCKGDPQVDAQKYLSRGDQNLAASKFPEAIIEYRRAVQANPSLGKARYQLAEAYATVGDPANALREYVRAADLMPDDPDAQKKAGLFMLLAGQFTDAQGLAQRILKRDPTNVDAQILLANALTGLKDMDGAVAAFEKAVAMDPNRATSYSELGSARAISGDPDKAEAAFRKAVEIDPKSVAAHLSLANFSWSRGDMKEAEQEMRRALELDPQHLTGNRAMAMFYMVTNKPEAAEPHLKVVADVMKGPEAKYYLAEYYLRLNRPDAARAVLQPLLKNDDTFVGASVRLARVEVVSGKNAEAHRLLEAVLARDAKNTDALTTRGKLYLSEGNTVSALSTLQAAVAGNPRSIEAQLELARTYETRTQTKEAITAYNDALKIDGGNLDARLGLARVHINNGEAADGLPLIAKVVEERPTNPQARLLLLYGLMAVNDLPQATRHLDILVKLAPDSAAVQTAAGRLAQMKNDTAAARTAYGRALEFDPRSYQALAGLLTTEMQGKQFGNARALIEKQLAQNPNDPNLLLMSAQTYNALGDAFAMEKALKKTVEVDPQSLQAYVMLGKMYYQQGRLDLARRELETYVGQAPNSVPANTMLGTILELQGRKDDAKARYNKALQIDPRAAVAANNLAWIDSNSNGNLDVALQLAQTAKSQLPNRHEVDDTLGWIYYKKGLSSMAVEALTQSALKAPDNPSYNYHLALAHHQNGNNAEAKKYLEKALASKSKFDQADEARKLLESIKG